MSATASTSADWWRARRVRYNVALAAAGIGAFVAQAVVIELVPPSAWAALPEPPELTLFTIAFQSAGFLVAMALANVCYGLGPLAERALRPGDPDAFRRRAYALGVGFSVALPFAVPAELLASVLGR